MLKIRQISDIHRQYSTLACLTYVEGGQAKWNLEGIRTGAVEIWEDYSRKGQCINNMSAK